MRYAIITPYYKEERRLIERCIDSVRNQSLRANQILIADGFPQNWIDTAGVRHFKLDRVVDGSRFPPLSPRIRSKPRLMKPYRGPPMTLGNAATAKMRAIVRCR